MELIKVVFLIYLGIPVLIRIGLMIYHLFFSRYKYCFSINSPFRFGDLDSLEISVNKILND